MGYDAAMKIALGLLLLAGAARAAQAPGGCVQIYYDSVPKAVPAYTYGRVHALELQNLLGHFPSLRQIVIPIERYEPGQLERCGASFYLGTYFDNAVPASFLADFAISSRTVVWAGYNVWKLPEADLSRLWGARFAGLSTLEPAERDARGRPVFFRWFDYKGETFEKYGEWDLKNPARFNAAHEIALLDLEPGAERSVVVWARREGARPARAPYVLARAGRWYVGDSPFSYITEEDRYLIFADLLFDMLGQPPRRAPGTPKPAHFRVEDVHPLLPAWQLYGLTDILARERVPFSIAVVPVWVDSLWSMKLPVRFAAAAARTPFADFARYASERRATFIMHGVTHEYGFARNPFTGVTGDDFEFWDRVKNRPVERDSPRFVIERLEDGLALLEDAGIRPAAWMTPHYQASPLDYLLFARLFAWSVGRVIYFPLTRARAPALPAALEMSASGAAANGRRLRALARTRADYPREMLPTGQFYPYEIYGDVYGQRVIPENVGNIQPYMNEQVLKSVSVDDMIRVMRRNAALRDTWASFFVHPSMLDSMANGGTALTPGDGAEIARLIRGARDAGYEFIELGAWIRAQPPELRPEPVEVRP